MMDHNINKPIKCVVWDLDDTYWDGTLSENGIHYNDDHHNLVIELSKRGIINSICSKNNFNEVQAELDKQGIWEYFVFPSISWDAKGQRLKSLIKDLQIKAENVLFIDDNPHNIEEARYYCEGIQTAEPSILSELLSHTCLQGKNDHELNRLKHYKILEIKSTESNKDSSDNIEFLKNSNIRVDIVNDVEPEIERIHEMLHRTNQLNFTKNRSTKEDLLSLISNSQTQAAFLKVKDNYGDYGIVGFYALKNKKLEHFLFSCRILNMGIEQWLYNKLGSPDIDIKPEISSDLNTPTNINWINQSSHTNETSVDNTDRTNNTQKILIKGNCDYDVMIPFITPADRVSFEFNYNGNAPLPIRNEHTEILKNSNASFRNKHKDILDKIPFVDENTYISQVHNKDFDIFIYNITMDYTYGLYQYADTDLVLPYQDFNIDLTNKDDQKKITNIGLYPDVFFEWFSENFNYIGPISEERFINNILWLCNELLNDKIIIFVNGTEIDFSHEIETNRWLHHKKMNIALENAVSQCKNALICDIRDIITSADDLTINVNRFSRKGYFEIARKLQEIISQNTAQTGFKVSYSSYLLKNYLNNILFMPGRAIKKISKHLLNTASGTK